MDPVNTGVVPAEAPEAVQPANTLDNVNKEVINELTSPTGESAGDAPVATTPAPSEPVAAPATPAEETPPAEADEGQMHRVSQHNAQMSAVLTKLGIDPNSDTMEAIASGLVTADEVIAARRPVAPGAVAPAASTPSAPETSLDQKLANLQSIIDKPIDPVTGVMSKDYVAMQKGVMDVVGSLVQENQNIKQSYEKKESAERANSMVAATGDVFNTQVADQLSAELPEEVRQIGAEMFLGATDIENISLANTFGKEKAVTANGYRHSATKVAPKMQRFIKAIYKAGQDSLNPNPTTTTPSAPTAPGTTVQVMRPGSGSPSIPPPAPKDHFALENLNQRTEEYFASPAVPV